MDPRIKAYFAKKGLLPEGYDDAESDARSVDSTRQGVGFIKLAGQLADNSANSSNSAILDNRFEDLGKAPTVREAPQQKTDFSIADSMVSSRGDAAKQRLEQMKADMRTSLGFAQGEDKLKADQAKNDSDNTFRNQEFAEKVRHNKATEAKSAKDASGPNKDALGFFDKYNGHPTTKDTNVTRTSYIKIKKALSNPSPANDMAGIFSYMKMLDPGSTVREGEFANAQNTTGVPGKVLNAYNNAMTGVILSPAQRLEFMKSAEQQAAAQEESQRGIDTQFSGFAAKYGYPTDGIIPSSSAPNTGGNLSSKEQAELDALEKKFGGR